MKPDDTSSTDPWHFPRPALAKAYLDAFDLKLSSARGLFARRRMGKTEFLQRDLLPAARAHGYIAAYTNLWDNRQEPDLALVAALAEALEPKGVKALLSRLKKPVRKLKVGGKIAGAAEGSLEAELASAPDRSQTLREILKELDGQKKNLLLVIDEAQVLASAAHSDFAHALRAALDIRKDRIKVIFAGSSETTLREMFARSSEPFYNWAALEPFPLLGKEFIEYTIKLMNSLARNRLNVEQGLHAFEELHKTPEFFKRFVERFMLYQTLGPAEALAHTKASVFSDENFLKQWSQMNMADRAVISLLARGETDLHSVAGLARLSALTGKNATKNTTAHALRRLQSANQVTKMAFGDYRIEDEAFAEWIRRRGDRLL